MAIAALYAQVPKMAKGPDCKSEARESVREFESPPVLQHTNPALCGVFCVSSSTIT